jgi:hypothetical protein
MDIEKLDMEIVIGEVQVLMAKLKVNSTLLEDVRMAQEKDEGINRIKERANKVEPWDSVSHQMVCSDIRIEFVYLIMTR